MVALNLLTSRCHLFGGPVSAAACEFQAYSISRIVNVVSSSLSAFRYSASARPAPFLSPPPTRLYLLKTLRILPPPVFVSRGQRAHHSPPDRNQIYSIYHRSTSAIDPRLSSHPTSARAPATSFPFPYTALHSIMAPTACVSVDQENRHLGDLSSLPSRTSDKKLAATPDKQKKSFSGLQSGSEISELQEPTAAQTKPRGALIVLEGLDRSGKSSQCEQLVEYLKSEGKKVQHIKFPDRTTVTGRSLDAYLKNALEMGDQAVHKIFFQNRLEKMEEMEAALVSGVSLIVDRYSYSGVAFSAAKGLDVEWCKNIETPLPAPDLVLFLNIPVEVAAQRGAYGEERYEKMDFQKKVGHQFEMLRDASWKDVDATESMECIQSKLRVLVNEVVGKCASGVPPLNRMWPS